MAKKRIFKGKFINDIRLYRIWGGMKQRCYNKNASNYKYYGAKGIIICDEWRDNFLSFYNWSLNNGYKKHLTIDRKRNEGIYSPENCRWVTLDIQLKNKINHFVCGVNHFRAKLTVEKVIHIRKQLVSTGEYAKMYGVSPSTVSALKSNYKRWPNAIP